MVLSYQEVRLTLPWPIYFDFITWPSGLTWGSPCCILPGARTLPTLSLITHFILMVTSLHQEVTELFKSLQHGCHASINGAHVWHTVVTHSLYAKKSVWRVRLFWVEHIFLNKHLFLLQVKKKRWMLYVLLPWKISLKCKWKHFRWLQSFSSFRTQMAWWLLNLSKCTKIEKFPHVFQNLDGMLNS